MYKIGECIKIFYVKYNIKTVYRDQSQRSRDGIGAMTYSRYFLQVKLKT